MQPEPSPTAPRTPATRPYFPVLDGVRALAALMVMVFHFNQQWIGYPEAVFGQTGVDLFFVLSGFLISTILLQSPTGDWHEVRTFFIRRVLRIFPLYFGYLALTSLAGVPTSWPYWLYLQNIVTSFGMHINGPQHFWSLGVEEQFYLVWPFVVLFSPRRWLPYLMAGCIAFSIVLRILLMHSRVDVFVFPLTRLDSLAAGSLLAFAFTRGMLPRLKPFFTVCIILGSAGLGGEWWYTHAHRIAWSEVVKYAAAAALYSGVIGLLLATRPTPIHRFLCSPFMRAIGAVSYGLYVFHPLLFHYLVPVLGPLPILLKELICFAAVYVLARVSFHFYERPFLRLKQVLAPEGRFRDVRASVPAASESVSEPALGN